MCDVSNFNKACAFSGGGVTGVWLAPKVGDVSAYLRDGLVTHIEGPLVWTYVELDETATYAESAQDNTYVQQLSMSTTFSFYTRDGVSALGNSRYVVVFQDTNGTSWLFGERVGARRTAMTAKSGTANEASAYQVTLTAYSDHIALPLEDGYSQTFNVLRACPTRFDLLYGPVVGYGHAPIAQYGKCIVTL